jgi:hypothetical protein
MRRVLWEVARLQGTIKRAHMVRKDLGDACPPGVNSLIWECFISEIDAAPCLADKLTPRQ